MSVTFDEIERRVQAFRHACNRAGIRITPQRVEIFREVARTEEHPDAETILRRVRRRMSNVSLDTVYRTLALLEELHLISKVEILCGRARFDGNTQRHHHFVCAACGLVRDFVTREWDHCAIPQEAKALGTVESVHVQVRGLCPACQAKKQRRIKRS